MSPRLVVVSFAHLMACCPDLLVAGPADVEGATRANRAGIDPDPMHVNSSARIAQRTTEGNSASAVRGSSARSGQVISRYVAY